MTRKAALNGVGRRGTHRETSGKAAKGPSQPALAGPLRLADVLLDDQQYAEYRSIANGVAEVCSDIRAKGMFWANIRRIRDPNAPDRVEDLPSVPMPLVEWPEASTKDFRAVWPRPSSEKLALCCDALATIYDLFDPQEAIVPPLKGQTGLMAMADSFQGPHVDWGPRENIVRLLLSIWAPPVHTAREMLAYVRRIIENVKSSTKGLSVRAGSAIVLWEGAPATDKNIRLARTRTAYLEAHGNVARAREALQADGHKVSNGAFYSHLNQLDGLDPGWRHSILVSSKNGNMESSGMSRSRLKQRAQRG